MKKKPPARSATSRAVRTCRRCGCTEFDCRGCIEHTGEACRWVDVDLCSACLPPQEVAATLLKGAKIGAFIRVSTHRTKTKAGGRAKTFSFRVQGRNGEELCATSQRYSRKIDLENAISLIRGARVVWL